MAISRRSSGLGPFVLGIGVTLTLGVVGAMAAVLGGYVPARADVMPPALEKWAARTSLDATIERETAGLKSPIAVNDATLSAGATLYAANCAMCHGASDGKPAPFANGLYIKSPLLAKHGVEDDPEATSFWKIQHGIRFTAMPAFGKQLTTQQLWQVSLFVAHLDHLPPHAEAAWLAMPSTAKPR